MDDLKLESNVKHRDWVVVCYIFHIMYGKVFDVMDNESV
jgi:hypothetical protein